MGKHYALKKQGNLVFYNNKKELGGYYAKWYRKSDMEISQT